MIDSEISNTGSSYVLRKKPKTRCPIRLATQVSWVALK